MGIMHPAMGFAWDRAVRWLKDMKPERSPTSEDLPGGPKPQNCPATCQSQREHRSDPQS
jgi:hypothetical protein